MDEHVDEHHPGTQPVVAAPEPAPVPPAGMEGETGLLFRIVTDQRIAFLIVGGINTVVGMGWFIVFDRTVGQHLGYMVSLVLALGGAVFEVAFLAALLALGRAPEATPSIPDATLIPDATVIPDATPV